ncbi:L,D-transpeptidase family protein [Nordella sp. HKS 07]|uniref:L,D-transpeptidase family protein n=1 Tax=Nordella sp. HKS 07 TaxID=2712222 RepID=UPI0013E0F08C|nr:L,D-transpeptidase family protein [Nordella sp. HKS 07]QIG51424.1 L,D-transpeptidase family protein [Nordella sp. HKS 07]
MESPRQLGFRHGAGIAVLLLSLASAPVFAQDTQDNGSAASVAPQVSAPGKLATRTQIVANNDELAMLTGGSEQALADAIVLYKQIVKNGGWPQITSKKLSKGAKGEQVLLLRQRLIFENYLPFDTLGGPNGSLFDAAMVDAVKAFQVNHGVAPTGTVGDRTLTELNIPAEIRLATLLENQPRVSAYAQDLGRRSILVNIPSLQLETVEDGRVFSRHNIVAGKLDRPSPTLVSTVSDVTFNPYWKIPASIVERDIVPHYLKDRSYLAKMQIRVFDGVDGPEIDPSTIDWANTPPERYFFRQDPGENNALATVKINFPNKFMVYMHDTPHRELFGSNARFESSGCIRVDQVQTVVDWVLRDQADYSPDQYGQIIGTRQPYELKVQTPPSVRFMYLTAWATPEGAINFRPDIYNLDGKGFVLGQPEPRGAPSTN